MSKSNRSNFILAYSISIITLALVFPSDLNVMGYILSIICVTLETLVVFVILNLIKYRR